MHILSSYIDKNQRTIKVTGCVVIKVVYVFQLVCTYVRIKAYEHTH